MTKVTKAAKMRKFTKGCAARVAHLQRPGQVFPDPAKQGFVDWATTAAWSAAAAGRQFVTSRGKPDWIAARDEPHGPVVQAAFRAAGFEASARGHEAHARTEYAGYRHETPEAQQQRNKTGWSEAFAAKAATRERQKVALEKIGVTGAIQKYILGGCCL